MIAVRLTAVSALCAVFSTPLSAQPAAQTVDVMSFSYQPKPIRLRAGRPVTLTFVNRSGSGHNFTAPDFFAAARIVAGAAPGGEVDLRGGEAKRITLVPRAGTYRVHCSRFMHAQLGMRNSIVVD